MPNHPKITVITPSFNQGKFIGDTIRSVVEQGYPNLEYIVMDGGSTDETVEVIKQFEDKISYWESVPDKGQTDAINKGLKRATGEVFNWLNSDDIYHENSLFRIGEAFRDETINVVLGNCVFFENETGKDLDLYSITRCKETVERTLAEMVMGQPGHFYRMSVIDQLGRQLEASFRYSMDMELWYRYLHDYGLNHIKTIDDIICHFRWHADSKTIAEGPEFKKDDNAIMFTMLQQCDAPQELLDYHDSPRTMEYDRKWSFRQVDRHKLIAFVANNLAMLHYSAHRYDQAASCISIAKNYGYPADLNFQVRYHAQTKLPAGFLEWVRKLKSGSKSGTA